MNRSNWASHLPDTTDLLKQIGLGRGPSSRMKAVSSFGVGLALGTGLALLLAPRAGAETRRRLRERFKGRQEQSRCTIDQGNGRAPGDQVSEAETRGLPQ